MVVWWGVFPRLTSGAQQIFFFRGGGVNFSVRQTNKFDNPFQTFSEKPHNRIASFLDTIEGKGDTMVLLSK